MIYNLRKEAGIAQKDLCRGIFNIAEYSRIERGEKETDKIHLEALFQRLGKSDDKLELAISMEEYQQMYLRHEALWVLSIGDVKSADKFIKGYVRYIDKGRTLHLQSFMLLKEVRNYVEKGKKDESIWQMEKTLELTFPEWREKSYENFYLCKQEIQILLLIAYLKMQQGKAVGAERLKAGEQEALEILEKLLDYILLRYTDEQECVKVFPQCLLILGTLYFRQKNIGKSLEMSGRGIELLAQNGVLMPMKELLALRRDCFVQIGETEEAEKCREQMKAILFLYQIAETKYPTEEIVTLLLTSMQGEAVVTNELVRELRTAKHMSQEELCEGICTRETLSRIESGKRSPNKKNLYAMLKKMGVERETYYGFIAADDYELYEKVRKYNMREGTSEKSMKEAESILKELEAKLDRRFAVNRQFLQIERLHRDCGGEEDWEQDLKVLKQLLNETMNEFEGRVYRVPFRQEAVILIRIAIFLRRLKREDEALDIYSQILERYQSGQVAEVFHAVPLFILYVNYVGLLENMGRICKAEEVAKEGINLGLECQRGDVAGEILANLSCVYEKKEDMKLAKICLKRSFQLLKLYQHKEDCSILKSAYENLYFEELS